jgi:glycosyltransferase involved in cell wall biosynthesis
MTVLLPVWNAEKHVAHTVAQVLGQSLENIELLVIDDGSTDGTGEMLRAFSDPRLRVIHQSTNRGLVSALNRGLEEARCELVARHDVDDYSVPDRLLLLRNEMTSRHDVVVLGSTAELMDEGGRLIGLRSVPLDRDYLGWCLGVRNPMIHGSVVFRREPIRAVGGYRKFELVEDYDLWCRVTRRFGPVLHNLPTPLYRYRVGAGVSASSHDVQVRRARALASYNRDLLRAYSARELVHQVDRHISAAPARDRAVHAARARRDLLLRGLRCGQKASVLEAARALYAYAVTHH